jgi:molybdenum cofactor biosynthesis enzyme MoaA
MKENKNILAVVNLTSKDTVKNLWEILSSVKKSYYSPKEKIVIIYSKQNNPKLLEAVKKILSHLDIPEFFVFYKEIDVPVDDSYTFYLNDNFCIFPWASLKFLSDGSTVPCCKYKKKLKNVGGELLNANKTSIKQIYFDKEMSHLRQTFKNNSWDSNCDICKKDEQAGLLSLRNQTNSKYLDILHKIDYQSEAIGNLKVLDLSLGNECNLSCRICNSDSSSSIAKEEKEYFNSTKKILIRASDDYFNNILEIAENINHLLIVGGEPVMSKKLYQFLESLINLGYSKNIKINLSTNATLYSEKFVKLCNEFKEVVVSLSIDDLGKRFEYQRNGSDWSTVESNIKKYLMYRSDNFKFTVHPAVNIQNVYYLPELIEWINNYDLSYTLTIVRNPAYLAIANLDLTARQKICEKLENFVNYKEIPGIMHILKNSNGSTNKKFFSYMKKLDQIRNQNFNDAHKEIAQIIGFH